DFIPSFIDPANSIVNNASIRSICKINGVSPPSSWNLAERSCYYDLSMTNDIGFAQTSLKTGTELVSNKVNSRSHPLFNPSLPLHRDLKEGDRVHLIMSASNEYPMNIVVLSSLHLPRNGVFDNST